MYTYFSSFLLQVKIESQRLLARGRSYRPNFTERVPFEHIKIEVVDAEEEGTDFPLYGLEETRPWHPGNQLKENSCRARGYLSSQNLANK